MKKKFILSNCYLKNLKHFWHIWPWWPWPLTQWPRIHRVPLKPRTDVWTKFEEGRSWRSGAIDRKPFWHIWTLVTLTFDPVTPKSIGFLFCQGSIFGQSLRKVGQGVLELLIGNGFGTFEFDPGVLGLWPSDPKINRVSLLPRRDVWTKFEEGRSRHSRGIDWKSKEWADLPTNMCKLFFNGGIKKIINNSFFGDCLWTTCVNICFYT